MIRFHDKYERATAPLDATLSGASLIAVRIDNDAMWLGSGKPQAGEEWFAHATIANDERIGCLGFIRFDGDQFVFPRAAAVLGKTYLETLAAGMRERGVAPGDVRTFRFGAHPLLDEIPENVVVPSLAAFPTLWLELDRYATVAARAAGRRVLELSARSGYGASTIADLAASYACDYDDDVTRNVARALRCFEPSMADGGPYDLVVALGVAPSRVAEVVARASERLAEGGQLAISSGGSAGKAALEACGFSVRQLPVTAYPMLYDEFVAIRETEPSYSIPAGGVRASVAARALAVALFLRPSSKHIFGGDVVQVRETAKALRERGHRVDVIAEWSADVAQFDIVHLSGITVVEETIVQAKNVASFEGPIVFMPIFADHCDEASWGMRTSIYPFLATKDDAQLKHYLEFLTARRMGSDATPAPPARAEQTLNYTAAQIEVMRYVDYIVANAWSEVHRLYRYLTPEVPFSLAPSCVNTDIYSPAAREAFVSRFQMQDFVLLAGRIENRKNQLLFFEAVRQKPERPVVCIGKAYEPVYAWLVRSRWPRNVVILPEVTEPELAGAFAAARVVAIPSWDEVVSLTALNSAVCEAALVLTRNAYEHEYIGDMGEYCDPGDPQSMADAIDRAWDGYAVRAQRRAELATHLRRTCTWEAAAAATEAAYYRVLASNPRGEERLRRVALAR